MTNTYFLDTIVRLRQTEEVILYGELLEISSIELKLLNYFLKSEYEEEALDYPFQAPVFDEKAALWAAKNLYFAAQLLLYRKHKLENLVQFLPVFQEKITVSAVLSADICLRFLAPVTKAANNIDVTDPILPILRSHLDAWFYSAVGYGFEVKNINWELIFSNPCLTQMFVNRIIERKDINLAKLPQIEAFVNASLGDYGSVFWKEKI